MTDKEIIEKMFKKIGINLLTDDTKCEIRDSEIPENTLFIEEGDEKAYYGARFYFDEKDDLINFDASY